MAVFFVNEGESIQAAINLANSGDTVMVAAGTYNESININDDIAVRSEDGAASTIINGQGSGFAFAVRLSASGAIFGDTNHELYP